MKRIFQKLTFSFFIASLIFCSCKKEKSCEGCETNQPTPSTNNTNRSPIANAGPDQTIKLPTDSVLLDGSSSNDPDGWIAAIKWRKISGPGSLSNNLVDEYSAQAKAINLTEGIYQFELTVKDPQGLTGKDSTTVTVVKKDTKEIIFNDQYWQCWWGCWITIPDLYSHLPIGTPFTIFIKRDNSNTWEEAFALSQTGYGYWVENDGTLIVYGDELGNDSPDIKIVY